MAHRVIAGRRIALLALAVATMGCATGTSVPRDESAASARAGTDDPQAPGLIPAGYGSLRQDDVALRLQVRGLQIRALPLDEGVIRLLSPDAYRSLAEFKRSRAAALDAIARRNGARELDLWLVSFFTAEPGETRYSPREIVIRNVGRDFRPVDVLALSSGFGEHRLTARQTKTALLVFDSQMDLDQPLVIQYETATNADWELVLSRLERERSLVRARAAAAARSP